MSIVYFFRKLGDNIRLNLTIRALLSAIGAITGYMCIRFLFWQNGIVEPGYMFYLLCCLAAIALAGIFYIATGEIYRTFSLFYDKAEKMVRALTVFEVGFACAGLVIGLAISFFLTLPLSDLKWIGLPITVLVNFLVGYIGMAIAVWKSHDIADMFQKNKSQPEEFPAVKKSDSRPKLLDTSVIIDGRISDIVRTGFLEGELIVPEFVLVELRHIADSTDSIKRNKGRRGLDVLNFIQDELGQKLRIEQHHLPKGYEVDAALVDLAQQNNWIVLTTDYNLNKVASFKGVKVLNINELNNAIKPLAMPGEEMTVQIVKDGKEVGQGVAYLPDGTMIVVEGGKVFLGEKVHVILTSVLQTAAGRMIFAKPKADEDQESRNGGNGKSYNELKAQNKRVQVNYVKMKKRNTSENQDKKAAGFE